MNNMRIQEIRDIRERISIEIAGMTSEQKKAYFNEGAERALKIIEEMKKKNNSVGMGKKGKG